MSKRSERRARHAAEVAEVKQQLLDAYSEGMEACGYKHREAVGYMSKRVDQLQAGTVPQEYETLREGMRQAVSQLEAGIAAAVTRYEAEQEG